MIKSKFPVILFAIFVFLLITFLLFVVWLAMVVKADSLRDFQDTTELERFLELGKMTALLPDSCKENVDQFIWASGLNGYKVERFRIASPDYYRYWYNAELKPNEGHGVGLVRVDGRNYLIEPTIPMAWELNVGYAGSRVGVSWE